MTIAFFATKVLFLRAADYPTFTNSPARPQSRRVKMGLVVSLADLNLRCLPAPTSSFDRSGETPSWDKGRRWWKYRRRLWFANSLRSHLGTPVRATVAYCASTSRARHRNSIRRATSRIVLIPSLTNHRALETEAEAQWMVYFRNKNVGQK